MKSGKPTRARHDLSPCEQRIIEHLIRYQMLMKSIWLSTSEFRSFAPDEVSKSVKQLSKAGWISAYPLCHGKYYFTLTASAVDQLELRDRRAGPMTEQDKIKAVARMYFCCQYRPECSLLTSSELAEFLKPTVKQLPKGFYRKRGDPKFLGYARVDGSLQSSARRPAQQIRSDVFRFCKTAAIARCIRQRCFELTWVTATKRRADSVMHVFRQYAKVGQTPVNVVVIPELLPLITSVPMSPLVQRT